MRYEINVVYPKMKIKRVMMISINGKCCDKAICTRGALSLPIGVCHRPVTRTNKMLNVQTKLSR
jgi:hypothetical protein